MDNEKQTIIKEKWQEICILRSQLTSDVSTIGDYKIVKTYEARLLGETDPYDTDALIKERQAIRDKINKLEQEIDEVANPATEDTANA